MKIRTSIKIKDKKTQSLVRRGKKGHLYLISIKNKNPRDKKRQG